MNCRKHKGLRAIRVGDGHGRGSTPSTDPILRVVDVRHVMFSAARTRAAADDLSTTPSAGQTGEFG